MTHIPEELLEQIERGNVLLFVGERVSRDVEGRAACDRWTAQLADRCNISEIKDLRFPEVAQEYQDQRNRQALVQFVRAQMEALGNAPQQIHRLIAGLTQCKVLVTTCFDRYLEQALAERNRPISVLVRNEDVPFTDEHRVQVYKLRGTVDRPDSLMLTSDQYEAFAEQLHTSLLLLVLQGYLARRTILFIGFDLADPYFRQLYRRAVDPLDAYARRSYALFEESPSWEVSSWCQRHNITVLEADAISFLETLHEQLAALPALPGVVAPPPVVVLPERPYKFLDYYETGDEGIFFGRDREILELTSLVNAHRLALLYGASGTGKTSLLLAGAVPRLERADPPYKTIYVRVIEEPARAIRNAVIRQLPSVDPAEGASLLDFLGTAAKTLDRTLVIILDQFEEFFVRNALNPELRAGFIAELAELYNARDVPVKVVLSLREDWLASLSEFWERIPEVSNIGMRLLPLTREQARQAITQPAEVRGVQYEEPLIGSLLADLSGGGTAEAARRGMVAPPQLQLVCNELFGRTERDGRTTITLADYQAVGTARGVLREYLRHVMARLGSEEQVLARRLLQELVTAQDTKDVKSLDELALALDVGVSELEPVLRVLFTARLLRQVEGDGDSQRCELAHEYLIEEIEQDAQTRQRKQAEKLVQQGMKNWQDHGRRPGLLLPADVLDLVGEARRVLRLAPEAQEFVLRSALESGREVGYWMGRVSDVERRVRVLAEAARSRRVNVRQRAAQALGTQDVPGVEEPLLALAMDSAEDASVRALAQQSLLSLTNRQESVVEHLLSRAWGPNRTEQRAALETLAGFPSGELPASLRLRVLATRARLRLAWLAERGMATPRRRAAALTAVLVVALLALAYAFSAGSYHVDRLPSPIPEEPNILVIRRGHPLLLLPGLGQEVVKTDLSVTLVADEHWSDVNNRQVRGLWIQRSDPGYQKWGEDLSAVLDLEAGLRMLWYLDRDRALLAIFEAGKAQDPASRELAAEALEQVVVAAPELASQQMAEFLIGLLADEEYPVRQVAVAALAQVVTADPELASPEMADALLGLLAHQDADVRSSAASALAQIMATRPAAIGRQVTQALVDLLAGESQDEGVVESAAFAVEQVTAAYPELADRSLAEALVALLAEADQNVDVLYSAARALAQVLAADPELASQGIADELLELLAGEGQDPYVQAGAADALAQLVAADPNLADQGTVDVLVELLLDEEQDEYAHERVVLALGVVAAANPGAASTEVELLAELVSEGDEFAPQALGQLAATSPEVAAQVAETLVYWLIEGEENMRIWAMDALHQAGESNPLAITLAAEELASLMGHDDYRGFFAREALRQIVSTKPEVGSDPLIMLLAENLTHDEQAVRDDAGSYLWPMLYNNPRLGNPQMVEILAGLLTDQNLDADLHEKVAIALWQVVTNNYELASHLTAESFLALLVTPSLNPTTYAYMADAYDLEQMLAANLSPASRQVAEDLIHLLTDPGQDREARESAAGALGLVVAADPTLASQELIETLVGVLTNQDEDPDVCREAGGALGAVMAANPTPASRQILVELLADESQDSFTREGAAAALARLVVADPNLANPQLVEPLTQLLSHENHYVSESAADALAQIVAVRPDLSDRQVVQGLVQMATESDHFVRFTAVKALEKVVAANPEVASHETAALAALSWDPGGDEIIHSASILRHIGLANPEAAPQVAESLTKLFARAPAYGDGDAAAALEQVVAANPQVGPQVIQALVEPLADADDELRQSSLDLVVRLVAEHPELAPQAAGALTGQLDDDSAQVRISTAGALGQVGAASPQVATEVTKVLRGLLADGSAPVRESAAGALGQVGTAHLEVGSQAVDALTHLLSDEQVEVRRRAAEALEQVYAHQALETGETGELLRVLADSQDVLRRPVAAHALFVASLDDPALGQTIIDRLEELSRSHRPVERMWANITLQMIDLAGLAHEAADRPSTRERTLLELDMLAQAEFLGNDFRWAAQEALLWLEPESIEEDPDRAPE